MSRIGKQPVPIPSGAKVTVDGQIVSVEGKLGKLQQTLSPKITAKVDEEAKVVIVSRGNDDRESKALHGLSRALINNMVQGVSEGYEKRLEIVGVGYLAAIQNNELQLRVGYANEVIKKIPAELDVTCPDQTHVLVKGCDKQKVGQFAAEAARCPKTGTVQGQGCSLPRRVREDQAR